MLRCTSMRGYGQLALLLLVAGCTAQPNASVAPGSPSPPVKPSAISETPSSSPVPLCKLPVISWYQPGSQGDVQLPPMGVQAHYVSYPGGSISEGAADQFTNGNDGFGWSTSASPVLRGTGPVGYYDVAFRRFLPVPRAQVSPDGRQYVYMDYTQGGLYAYGQLHVVDVASGHDRVLQLQAAQYLIFDFSADGIYFTYGPLGQSAGLSLLNPDTGTVHQVFPDGYVIAVSNGKAWIAVNGQDQHPSSPLPAGEGNPKPVVLNVLLRRDIHSGQVEEWLLRPAAAPHFELLGVYGGAPAVLVYLAAEGDPRWSTNQVPYEVWLMSQPMTPDTVDSGVSAGLWSDPWYRTGRVATSPSSNLGISDSHGIWLGGDGIYLYQHGNGLARVANFPGFPANGCT